MSVNRALVNTKNKLNGDQLEKFITQGCNYYLAQNVAIIEKTPEPFHMIMPLGNGQVRGFYEKKAQPDFQGTLCDGSSVLFDAKYTGKEQIMQNVVTEKQWELLDVSNSFGAHCFIVVSIQFQKFYRVPWAVWKNMKTIFGHKYMNREELSPYEIKLTTQGLLFLEGIDVYSLPLKSHMMHSDCMIEVSKIGR